MAVIHTDEWLSESYASPIKICEKLTRYFPEGINEREIYQYLRLHGMYRPLGLKEPLDSLPKDVWNIVRKKVQNLKSHWDGPDIPIFIFPADTQNRRIVREFNGKSGLSFMDKLFLFFIKENSKEEITAVLTHEYNHVCRLHKQKKSEKNLTLLDSIIMEGLAENAVREQCGEKYVAKWTTYYSEQELIKFWKEIILPNKNIKKNDRKHNSIMYGTGMYPSMTGYSVGYYLVKRYMVLKESNSKNLFAIETEKIIDTVIAKK